MSSLIYRIRHLMPITSSSKSSLLLRTLATSASSSNANGFPTVAEKKRSQTSRAKSSAAFVDDDDQTNKTPSRPPVENTFSPNKSGTPSPWAVFDAWGAGADIADPMSPEMERLLEHDSVQIPMNETERGSLAG